MHSLLNGTAERNGKCESKEERKVVPSPWFPSRVSLNAEPGAATEDHAEEEVAQVMSWLRVLIGEGNVAELRALKILDGDSSYPQTKYGFFDSDHFEQMAEAALQLTKTAEGVYFTLNPVNSALVSRCWNRVVPARKGDTTTDADVLCRRWLLVDADPSRPAGVSASDEEKAIVVWPVYKWVAVAQVPYFVWVSIATVLQLSITAMNWGR